eukprot:3726739-Prymnesium_polylepis.1
MRIQDSAERRRAVLIRASLDRVEPEGDELDGRERCGCVVVALSLLDPHEVQQVAGMGGAPFEELVELVEHGHSDTLYAI